jgi:hypothetical protein
MSRRAPQHMASWRTCQCDPSTMTPEGVDRIQKIVGAMKEFSHPAMDRTPLDINRAIAFRADNAVDKAPATKGTISVSTRCIDDWAEIRIQDTGCGIPTEIRAGEASVRNSKRDSREMAFCGICDTESTRS